jgi:hypothetical protein
MKEVSMSKTRATVLAISLTLSPAIADAACTQADLAGSWQAYVFNSQEQWFRCRLQINGAGDVADTTCVTTSTSAALTRGTVDLIAPAVCTYTAQYKLKGFPHKIDHITLSKDKTIATGVGFAGNVKFIVHFTKL